MARSAVADSCHLSDPDTSLSLGAFNFKDQVTAVLKVRSQGYE